MIDSEWVRPFVRMAVMVIGLTVFGLVVAGCWSPVRLAPASSVHTSLSPSVPTSENLSFGENNSLETFALFIAEERVAIAQRNLSMLGALWAPNAQIIDQRGTENTEDDYIWRGRSAILDRYEIAVFRFSPPLIDPPTDLHLSCPSSQLEATEGENAASAKKEAGTLPPVELFCLKDKVSNGTIINASREGDRWQFIYQQGRWWISSLTYN